MLTQAFIEDVGTRYAMDMKNVIRMYVTKEDMRLYNNLMSNNRIVMNSPYGNMAGGVLTRQWTAAGAIEISTDMTLKEGTFGIEVDGLPFVEIFEYDNFERDYDA